jgi:hypothetical protein
MSKNVKTSPSPPPVSQVSGTSSSNPNTNPSTSPRASSLKNTNSKNNNNSLSGKGKSKDSDELESDTIALSPPTSSSDKYTELETGAGREFDDSDDLLSDYTSETTFFDGERSGSTLGSKAKDVWHFISYKSDGRVHIFGEWVARTKAHRYIVIGPDWACVAMTYIVIIVPSIFVSLYLLENLAEKIVYFILFGLCIFGLTTVFIADPGLVRKYHHARSRHWTYW